MTRKIHSFGPPSFPYVIRKPHQFSLDKATSLSITFLFFLGGRILAGTIHAFIDHIDDKGQQKYIQTDHRGVSIFDLKQHQDQDGNP